MKKKGLRRVRRCMGLWDVRWDGNKKEKEEEEGKEQRK